MTERYQHHVKDLPDYIRSIYQHKGVVSIKFSNSHCGDCQKESFQEYANRINTERSIEEVLERENIKCPLHGEYLQLHLSSFSMWEYRIKHATAKIEPLEVPQPPTVPSYLWEEWAKFWNCHKEVYISLFWIHRFEEYCNRDSVSWKSNVFKDLPELEKEIRYCDYIDLCYEIDFTDDSYFSEEVFNKKADILWKELCFKRFWIQFRLYLRNRDFQVVEELGNFFETKGVCGNIEPYDFERNFYLHIPKEVLTYTYVPLYLDIPVEDDADITINVFGAAGVSNRSREESHLTVEAVRGVEWLENLRPPENPDDLLVNPDVENPEQNLVVEHFPDVFINPDVENPEQNLVVENFPDVVVNPDVENPDSNLSDRISPDEHVVNPDIEDSDSVFCGEGSPSAVVGSLDVEIPDSNLSGKLSPNEQIVSPDIENPDQNLSGGSPPDEVVVTPDAENPDPDLSGESSPDEEVVNPDVENPDPDLSDESSPDEEVVNPDVENPDPDLSGESSPDEGIVVAPGAENPDPDLSGESSDEVVNPDAENPDPDLSGESSPDEEVVVNPDVENPDPDLPGESFPDEGIVVVPGAENPDPDLSGESSPDEEEVNPDVENPDPDLSDECSPDEVVSPDVENPDPDLPGEISPDVQVHGSPSPRNEEDQREEKEKISDESEDLIVSPPQPFEDIEAEEEDSSSDDIIIEDDDESEDLNVPPPQPILDIQVEGVDFPAQDRIQMIQDDYAVENNDLIIPSPELFQDVPPPQPLEEVASNVIQEQVLTEEERENDEIQVNPPVPAVPTNEDEGNDGLQLERVDSTVSYVRRLAGSVLARFSHFKRMIMRERDEIQVNPPDPAVPINEDERNDGLQLERVDSTVNYGRHLAGGVLARFSNFRNAVFLRSDSYLSWLNPIFRPRSISGSRFYGYYSDYWWFSYKLQVKYRAENIMQSLEKEIVDFLKSSCDPDLDHVLFYPPLMPCENEHITECWQVRTATLRLDEKIMKICILGKEEIEKEDIGSREISIVQLSKRDQHDEWNELKYGDVVPMELEVFEKKIMRSFQRRPLREAEEEGGEPFPRASSAAEAVPPSANSTFNEESFLSGDLIVYPPDDLNPIDINRESSRPPNDFFDEILSFCEAIYHDEGKLNLRNLPCNFDSNYLKFWMRRHTLSSLYSKGVEIIEECWYTTPPEIISKSIAKRIGLRRYRSVIDANCGSGLNAIQLALSNELVIAIDKNPANIRSARNNARIYGVEDKIIYKVGDLSTMDLSEFEPGAIFLNPKTNDPRRILKEYDVLGLGGTSDCKKLLDDARKISPNIVLYLPPHSNIFQVLEVCKPFGKAEIQFNNVSNQKESICVYFGDFVH